MEDLATMLDERGQSLRHSKGLESRLFGVSSELLPPPRTLGFPNHILRITAAACLLIACALTLRFYAQLPTSGVETNSVDFSLAFGSETSGESRMALTEDRENLIFTILEARADVGLAEVDIHEATDPVSLAFAPILGSTGFGFDDLETEIRSIEGTMGR